MKKERKVTEQFISANMFDVDVHHNGYQGGDAGHGGFVDIKFKNFQDTSLEVTVRDGENVQQIHHFHPEGGGMIFTQPSSLQLVFKGSTERDTLVEALEFIVKELKENK